MNKKINLRDFIKVVDGITYECRFTNEHVYCSEYSDDPHGPNSEISCYLKDFLDKKTDNAIRCQNIIKSNFGQEKLELFIYFLEKHFQEIN